MAIACDGDFLMNGQELATAVQHSVAVLVIVMDNQQFATNHDHQERRYPGQISGTQLRNPDFAAMARSFGAHGETVTARRCVCRRRFALIAAKSKSCAAATR